MPPFGLAHRLLSGRHPDTSPPAGGADPDDGQVATWSTALEAWIAADPAGGVTDHGLLTGLVPDDDHTQYALLAGRSGGQAFVGGTGSGDKLGLTCRSGAVAGLLELQETSPHVALTGDLDVSAHAAIGAAASPSAQDLLAIKDTITESAIGYGINVDVKGSRATGAQITYGVTGKATSQGTPTIIGLAGLYFSASHESSGPVSIFAGCAAAIASLAAGTGAVGTAQAFFAPAATWGGAKPSVTCGLDIQEQGAVGVGTALGVRVAQQTGTLAYLMELTGAFSFPYLRVLAGAAPGAFQTMLYLAEGGYNLRRVQWMDPGAGGANFVGGERVMVLV